MKSKPVKADRVAQMERLIDEATFDSNQRAKNTLEYEQMLMQFISKEFNNTLNGGE